MGLRVMRQRLFQRKGQEMAKKALTKTVAVKVPKTQTTPRVKKSPKEKILKDLGRRLILTEDYVSGETRQSSGTEYGVVIYYNGAVKPNI